MRKKIVLILLFLILFGASYFRLGGVFSNSFAFTYDVGRDMLKVSEIVNQHKLLLIGFTTGLEGVFYGPWWYYILSFPFFLSSGDPQFIAGFIALTGIAVVAHLYLFGKKLENAGFGLILSFLAGFSTALIGLSSQIWNPNIAPLLIVISLFIIYRFIHKPTALDFFLYGVISCLLIDTEIVFGILLLTGSVLGLLLISRKSVLKKRSLFFIPGILLILAPRIIFDIRHDFLMTNNLLKMLFSQKETLSSNLFSTIPGKLDIFYGLYADTLTGGSKVATLILLIIIILFTVLYYKKFSAVAKKFLLLSIIIVSTFVTGILFFSHDIWPHYLVGLPVYFCLITAIPLYYGTRYIKFGKIYLILILIMLFWINIKPIQVISDLQKPIWEGDSAVYRNQLAVVDYVYKQAKGKPFNYIAYSPAVFSYPYDYLFLWYGKKVFNYIPDKNHQKLFFVVIEPEFQRPQLLKEWLKLREKDGIILNEQKVKGGVVVQTREH